MVLCIALHDADTINFLEDPNVGKRNYLGIELDSDPSTPAEGTGGTSL